MKAKKSKKSPPNLTGESDATRFFYEHAGCGYQPNKETEDEGRLRGARTLAKAEAWFAAAGGVVEWEEEQFPDYSGIDHTGPLYCCLAHVSCHCGAQCCRGRRQGSLCNIDLGANADSNDPYKRVVEAELALELMSDD